MIIEFLRQEGVGLSDRASLVRLKSHCKNAVLGLSATVAENITGEFDGTGCIRAVEPIRELPNGSLDVTIRRCHPDRIQCTVHTFFKKHEDACVELTKSAEREANVSTELKQMCVHVEYARNEATHLCDDRHCCKLADMLIALDGQDMDEFVANNDSEWKPISRVLRKPLLNPVSGQRFRV